MIQAPDRPFQAIVIMLLLCGCDVATVQTAHIPFADIVDARRPVEMAVAMAANVALIEVLDARSVDFVGRSCGWAVSGRIVEAFKGAGSQVEYFVANDNGESEPTGSYLVFLYKTPAISEDTSEFLNEHATADERLNIYCRAEMEFYIPILGKTMWKVTDGLGRSRSQGIVQDNWTGVFWCLDPQEGEFAGKFRNAEFEGGVRERFDPDIGAPVDEYWIELDTVRKLIRRALDNSPFPDGVTPSMSGPLRPDFQFGSC